MKLRHLLPMLALIVISGGCDTDTDDVNCDFDAQAMRANYADNLIIPALEEWHTSTQLLSSMAGYFASSPDAQNLVELRIIYWESYRALQRVSAFAFGPGVIGGAAFRDLVNTFPTNVNLINSYVAAGTIDAAVNPNSIVGYPALDHLLFLTAGSSMDDVVASFTTGPDAANRRAYLTSIAQRINSIAATQTADWESYRSTFVNSSGSGEGSTLEQLVNQFNRDFENLKNYKFKIPLGKFNGGVVMPEQVEAYYSGGSAQLAKDQLAALRNMYLGVGMNGSDGLGLDDYLECLRAGADSDGLLSEAIRDQLQNVTDAFALLEDPMSAQLVSNKPVVDEAHTQMQMLVPLTKREMSGALGVQISYQSNDGD